MMEDLLHSSLPSDAEIPTRAPSEINFVAESTHSFAQSALNNTAKSGTDSQLALKHNGESRSSIHDTPTTLSHNRKQNFHLTTNYNRWRFFLLTWKRLELLKVDWTRRKLFYENINNSDLYAKFSEIYKKDVLMPVLKILIKNPEVREMYENVVDFKQPILLPPDVSELDSKIKQVR